MNEPATPSETRLVRYARYALLVTIGALPLYVVRWHYGPLPTTLLETLILVTVALYAVGRWRDGLRRPVATPYDVPIALLLVAGAISIFVASDHRGALGLYRAYFVEAVAVFYVAADLLRRNGSVQRTVIALAVGSSVFAVLNIGAFLQAVAAHQLNVGSAPNALYGDANYVAMYLEPPVAIAAGLLLFGPTARWRLLGGAWGAVAGLALLLTFSKGTYVALCVAAAVAFLTIPSWRWKAGLAAAFVTGAIVFTRVPAVAQRLGTVDSSIESRIQLGASAVHALQQHPLFGLGLGGYSYKLYRVSPELYPHDIWLTFWVEIGLLGVVAFGIILFMLLWRGWRAWARQEAFSRAALWGVLAALVIWFVHGFVDSPYWKNDMSVEFWVLAAIQTVIVGSSLVPRAAHDREPRSLVAEKR